MILSRICEPITHLHLVPFDEDKEGLGIDLTAPIEFRNRENLDSPIAWFGWPSHTLFNLMSRAAKRETAKYEDVGHFFMVLRLFCAKNIRMGLTYRDPQ